MPELRCPECGKELLPPRQYSGEEPCICTACGREVYPSSKSTAEVKCPTCGKPNKTTVVK